jgi:hypothetical protein
MWRDFFDFCDEHGGPVQIRAAARAAGLTPRQVRRRARAEHWWQPYGDIVAPPGIAPRPGAVQVAVDARRRLESGPRFRPHRLRGLDAGDIRLEADHGLAVLTPSRLLRELAAVATVPRLTTLVIDLVQQRQLALDDLHDVLGRHSNFPGRARLRTVGARLDEAGRTDSIRELDARGRLLRAGIPLDAGQVAVPCRDGVTIHFDLGIAAIGLGIDVDSMLAHATRDQLRKDVRRSNQVALLPDEWRVARMTVEDLDAGWSEFLALVRALVTEQSRRWLGRDWP